VISCQTGLDWLLHVSHNLARAVCRAAALTRCMMCTSQLTYFNDSLNFIWIKRLTQKIVKLVKRTPKLRSNKLKLIEKLDVCYVHSSEMKNNSKLCKARKIRQPSEPTIPVSAVKCDTTIELTSSSPVFLWFKF
ncbi:MAG: hypothetical protein MJE68_02140, partial [Proteobacteria bacterium]|nr:hypothetical protein [Pseudomonadota bacterium]